MDTRPQDDWERLGTALKRRRGELGYGYRQRVQFADDAGMGAKTISRMENGERPGYPAETIAQAEAAYRLRPGAISRFLAGAGELEPLPADGAAAPDTESGAPAGTPEFVAANWHHQTVRQLWQDESLDDQTRDQRILFFLAILEGNSRQREDATVTELRRANGA